jgi:hypothetical protein
VKHGRYPTVMAFCLALSSMPVDGDLLLNDACDRRQTRPAPWFGARRLRSAQIRHWDDVL